MDSLRAISLIDFEAVCNQVIDAGVDHVDNNMEYVRGINQLNSVSSSGNILNCVLKNNTHRTFSEFYESDTLLKCGKIAAANWSETNKIEIFCFLSGLFPQIMMFFPWLGCVCIVPSVWVVYVGLIPVYDLVVSTSCILHLFMLLHLFSECTKE
jgi:hypothetical protein